MLARPHAKIKIIYILWALQRKENSNTNDLQQKPDDSKNHNFTHLIHYKQIAKTNMFF